jgi:hypothetical protein
MGIYFCLEKTSFWHRAFSTPAWGPGVTVYYTNSFIFTKEVSPLGIITGSYEAKNDEGIGEDSAKSQPDPALLPRI